MVARDGEAAGGGDGERDGRSGGGGIRAVNEMQPGVAGFLGVRDVPSGGSEGEGAGGADLAAHLGVEGRAVEDDGERVVFDADYFANGGVERELVVAGEGGGGLVGEVGEGNDFALLGGFGTFALLLHEHLESRRVYGEAAFASEEFGEVEREAVGVVEFENEVAGEGFSGEAGDLFLEEFHAPVEGSVEGFFFDADDVFDVGLAGADFGEDVAHRLGEDADEFVEEGFVEAECAPVADGAAEDAAEDVVAVGVAGLDAVGDGEGEGADVVGDDAEGDVHALLSGVRGGAGRGEGAGVVLAGEFFEGVEEGAEDVGFVVGDDAVELFEVAGALEDGGDALEAHAGIHMAGGERDEGAVGVGVELNEDEVPDFHAGGVAFVDEGAGGVARGGEVNVQFRARAAGAGLAHHPEVVLFVAVDDVNGGVESGGAEFPGPCVVGVLVKFGGVALACVWGIDGGVEAGSGEVPDLGDEFPCPVNGFALEVVAE